MRDCANCEHYVVTDTRTNWGSQETTKIYGCELRECKFKAKRMESENSYVGLITKEAARKAILDHQYSNEFCEEHNIDHRNVLVVERKHHLIVTNFFIGIVLTVEQI